MPNGVQKDIDCAKLLVNHLDIKYYIINIKDSVKAIDVGNITNVVSVTCDEFDFNISNNNNDSVDSEIESLNNVSSHTHNFIHGHGISMQHTGNPILVLLIMFIIFGTGLIRRKN